MTAPVPPHLSDDERAIREFAQAVVDAANADEANPTGLSSMALSAAHDAYDANVSPDAVLSLLTALSSERTRADRWKTEAEQWEEREANCCPEDMSMEENIGALIRERDEARGALSTEREAGERLLDALAKRCLADMNAAREYPNDWPAGQDWDELVGSSQSIFRRRAREEAGIAAPSTETPHA